LRVKSKGTSSIFHLEGLTNHLLAGDLNCELTGLPNPKLQGTKGWASVHHA